MRRTDSDRREVMRKIRCVLDTFRTSVSQPTRADQEIIQETLRLDHFQVKRTFRHGFPFQPTALAYDPIQALLAIGSKCGSLRILGQAGVDVHVRHDMEGPPGTTAVLQLHFLVNEGALISATADDTLHLWNFNQKVPQITQSLKFQKEKITCMHLPLQSKWLYVGTERGNVHVVQIESFSLSGYIINWNKAIEYSRKKHPGSIVHLSDNPLDASKLLIGYECGQVVLWDLRNRSADLRVQCSEDLCSIAWHHEGKQFMCSHTDGSLTTWNVKMPNKATHLSQPHAKVGKDGVIDQCKLIPKVEWKSSRTGEAFVIFSGGMPRDQSGRTPCITVVHNKTTTVLEMEHPVVDFITLCESPYNSEMQEPYAIVVLLQNDLVVIDLQTSGFPSIENPYPMDLHESPVTCCNYLADCPADLIPAFYCVGSARTPKRQGFSERTWPIKGGDWASTSCSYSELIITGHSDGSIKFWDASAGTLQVLYKLKTAKVFEKLNKRSMDSVDDEPFAVHMISMCPEARKMAVAGASSCVILFAFKKTESNDDVSVLEIPIVYEVPEEGIASSPDCQFAGAAAGSISGGSANRIDLLDSCSDPKRELKVRTGPHKKPPGFQAQLVCLTPWNNGEPPSHITALTINSSYGLMAYGNEAGLVIVDIEQKVCLLNIGSPDLYGAQDPYSRVPRSPKRSNNASSENTLAALERDDQRQPRSPSIDQEFRNKINGMCSPASSGCPSSSAGPGVSGGGGVGGGSASGSVASGGRSRPDPPRRSRSQDKLDSSFSRSRSSSMSSLENITSEAIQCLAFADTYPKRAENYLTPSLWIGTSLGSVLTILINPPDADSRSSQPVVVSLTGGTIFRLKGAILLLSFLDCNGTLIPSSFECWRDDISNRRDSKMGTPTKISANRMSPTLGENNRESGDRQYAIIVSEKQARVVGLPSQICLYRQQVADTDFVVRVGTVTIRDSVCLICYVSNGHLQAYSLPSLRPLLDVDFLPLSELRISKTFCFSNRGHGLYLTSPSELQKFTVCADFCAKMHELLCDLFIAKDMPEAPKPSFLSGLFGGGVRLLDREELFGESSGKANKNVAKHIPGSLQDMNAQVNKSANEISRAHRLMVERGEKLNRLEDSAERMASEAQQFSGTSHELMLKYKDKKWYQL